LRLRAGRAATVCPPSRSQSVLLLEVWVEMRGEMREASDADLLGHCDSDADAFAVFYRRYEGLVAGWLMSQTRRADMAAELTAEVFAAAYLAAPRFRAGPEPAGAWLLGIARNKLLRSLRRARTETSARRRLGVERVEFTDESLAELEQLGDGRVLALLEQLPEDQREAVRARIIDELSYDELAEITQVSPTVARKRVSRGLAALRRRFEQQGGQR
jgi:RNA polymerase sigma factor (sigma-70 family)